MIEHSFDDSHSSESDRSLNFLNQIKADNRNEELWNKIIIEKLENIINNLLYIELGYVLDEISKDAADKIHGETEELTEIIKLLS